MKVTKTEIRFKTGFQQPKTGLPKKPVLTSLLPTACSGICLPRKVLQVHIGSVVYYICDAPPQYQSHLLKQKMSF